MRNKMERAGIIFCAATLCISTVLIVRRAYGLEQAQWQFEQMASSVEAVGQEEKRKQAEHDGEADHLESKEKVLEILPEYRELYEENQDFAGWISVEGTRIDYPVMWTPEEPEYYLHRDFYGKESYAGTPFVGSGNLNGEKGSCVFVYGHNMRNKTMFADLHQYQNLEYWENHQEIELDTLYERVSYEIFAVVYVNEEDWQSKDGLLYPFLSEGRDNETISKFIQASIYETDLILKNDESLLFLVTCSSHKGAERLIVAARKK